MEPQSVATFQQISSSTGHTTKTEAANGEEGDVLKTTQTVHIFKTTSVNTTQKTIRVDEGQNFIRDVPIRRSTLSRDAYLKLHRSSLKSSRHSVDVLKGKYENLANTNNDGDNAANQTDNGGIGALLKADQAEPLQNKPTPTAKLSIDTVEDLKNKYSPRSYGYSNPGEVDVIKSEKKAPPPPPQRTSTLSYQKPTPPPKENNVIIRQSSSEDSLDQLEGFLSEFTMEPKKDQKEKKRTSSFRRILSSSIFGKDKKKGEKKNADKTKAKKTENAVFSDNVQNEQAINKTTKQEFYAETKPDVKDHHYADIQIEDMSEIERRYAQMHINQFNQIKANFANPESFKQPPTNDYAHVDEKKSNYMNVADKYIDTSSSNNTLDSTYEKSKDAAREFTKSPERFQETPPRAQETYQNLQLVKPKALIPINSERPLPNPYHNDEPKQTIERNLNFDGKEYPSKQPIYDRNDDFSDGVYGTVYDRKVAPKYEKYSPNLTKSSNSSSTNSPNSPTFTSRSSPRSPTLETSKLRLPPNREKIELQPRIKSPIPQPKISTDKIIATELLKPKSEGKRHLSQQRLEFDYPENNLSGTKEVNYNAKSEQERKTYYTASDAFQAAKWHNAQRELAKSPSLLTDDSSQFTTDATVHVDSPIMRNNKQYASLPPSSRSRSATREPVQMRQRSVTPVRRIPSTSSLQQSPQKHEIRQSVEIYCWKELQKLKDKQDQELRCQMQYTPYGYVEDPIILRRSRSVEPNQRNSRRSTSLPRELKPSQVERNARMYHQSIPENRPIIYGENDIYAQKNPNFVRGSPQRRTVGLVPDQKGLPENYYSNGADVAYRPIFNRGSLTPQAHMDMQSQMYKKVSFSNSQNVQQWPTKNGFVQSPPQRRLDKGMSVGDDEVFTAVTQVDSRKAQNDIDVQIRQMNQQIQKEMLKNKDSPKITQRHAKEIEEYATKRNVNGNTRKQNEANHYAGKNTRLEPLYVRQVHVNENPYGSRQQILLENPYPNQIDNRYVARNENVYGTRQQFENPYGTRPVQNVYDNQKKEFGPKQIREPIYGSKQQMVNENVYGMKPPVEMKESPYARRPQDPNLYASKQSIAESVYGTNQKHVTLSNKVCDMYGKIHDSGKPVPVSPTNYGQIHQTGVIYGQLQPNNQPMGRPPQHQSYNALSNNFVRGNRLTASANDMYKRYQIDPRYHGDVVYEEGVYVQRQIFNPDAPLPPTPSEGKTKYLMRRPSGRAHPTISDTESDTSEVRRIMKRNYLIGK